MASKPLVAPSKEPTEALDGLGSDAIHRNELFSLRIIPRLATPINEYRDQTPCSADSSRKLPLVSPASFSNIERGVSLPENRDETRGITRYLVESSIA